MYTYIWYSLPNEKLRKWTGHFFKKKVVCTLSVYPGAEGCSHKAGVKIQLEYDLLNGELSDVEIESGQQSDQAYSATRTGMTQKNELYIRDLGYFRLQDFKSIQDKQGYYLARLKLPTKIYRKEFDTVVFKTKPVPLDLWFPIQLQIIQVYLFLRPGHQSPALPFSILYLLTLLSQ